MDVNERRPAGSTQGQKNSVKIERGSTMNRKDGEAQGQLGDRNDSPSKDGRRTSEPIMVWPRKTCKFQKLESEGVKVSIRSSGIVRLSRCVIVCSLRASSNSQPRSCRDSNRSSASFRSCWSPELTTKYDSNNQHGMVAMVIFSG